MCAYWHLYFNCANWEFWERLLSVRTMNALSAASCSSLTGIRDLVAVGFYFAFFPKISVGIHDNMMKLELYLTYLHAYHSLITLWGKSERFMGFSFYLPLFVCFVLFYVRCSRRRKAPVWWSSHSPWKQTVLSVCGLILHNELKCMLGLSCIGAKLNWIGKVKINHIGDSCLYCRHGDVKHNSSCK